MSFSFRPRDANPALTLADFAKMQKGEVQVLHYNETNRGLFVWVHDRVEGDRVFGRYVYPGEKLDDASEVDGYLYEFDGVVCRGSGAEPVHLEMPEEPDPTGCEDEECGAAGWGR